MSWLLVSTELNFRVRISSILSATLSSCILATSSLVADNLARAESWDLLRDTLILTLSHRFFADDKPLALLTAPTVCRGMVRLLDIADSGLSMDFLC